MARIRSIGELNWSMFEVEEDGKTFVDLGPDTAPIIIDRGKWELSFFLLTDRQVPVPPGFNEVVIFDSDSARLVLEDTITGGEDQCLESDEANFFNAQLLRMFERLNVLYNLEFVFTSRHHIPNSITIFFVIIVDGPVFNPDRFLQSLARKMSKWAKETR